MEIIVFILGFFIGLFLFLFLNEIFQIYYLGFKGLISTFFGCWFAGNIIVVIFGFAIKWLIIIFAVLWLLAKIFNGKEADKKANQNKGQ